MEVQNLGAYREAYDFLRRNLTGVELTVKLAQASDGSVDVDAATLNRVYNGKTKDFKTLASPAKAYVFVLAMMYIGLDQDLLAHPVYVEGTKLASSILGTKLADILFHMNNPLYTIFEQTSPKTIKTLLKNHIEYWASE